MASDHEATSAHGGRRAVPPGGGGVATRVEPRLVNAKAIEVPAPTVAPLRPQHLAAGTALGAYEIIRPLGAGGMGQVYLARDVKLGRRVAIKFLINNDADAELAARFLIEARATARCQHENIVVIHEVDEHRGCPFMVLEYLEGQTLDRLFADAPVAAARALDALIPVVRALCHAHAQGILHRDLKPGNILVSDSGVVKVLDFGLAKAFDAADVRGPAVALADLDDSGGDSLLTAVGTVMGTLPYMSPQQLLGVALDGRTDIWAVGVMLHVLCTGRHPFQSDLRNQLRHHAAHIDLPMPSAAVAAPELPRELVAVIDRCLQKQVSDRYQSAPELLDALEAVFPHGPHGGTAQLADGVCPYPGLASFGEDDAERFFGRAADVRRATARLADQPLLAVVGPSGAGKSSFVRAGLAPALRRAAEPWEVLSTRPGRDALAGLAELAVAAGASEAGLLDRLRAEPGTLGALLRGRARATRRPILLFVDQFEELFTLVAAPEDRRAYMAALAGVADDVAAPVRAVVSMRSDFLDRAAEDPQFMAQLTRGLLFLAPLERAGLREALSRPAAMAGYAFESGELVEEMIDSLELAPGALPLLQFTAARLWDTRDLSARRLTYASYQNMGGVAGALSAHADQVVADLAPAAQRMVRAIFLRLVTAERTRAIVDLRELTEAAADLVATRALIDRLVRARLLVVSTGTDEPSVEIVHESLISNWPLLGRWLEEEKEVVAFQAQLRAAAKVWDDRARPAGLLWHDQALAEARRFHQRFRHVELPRRERAFLDEAFALDERGRRSRRRLLIAGFVVLGVIAAGALAAMLWVRGAEHESLVQAERARDGAERALAAEHSATAAAARADQERVQREAAQREAAHASAQVGEKDEDLRQANARLQQSLDEQRRLTDGAREAQAGAEREKDRAQHEAERAQRAEADVRAKQRELEILLHEREQQVTKLQKQLSKISTDLK